MPTLSPRDESGRYSFGYVRSVIENGWRSILQGFEGTNDRGLDGTVLDFYNGVAQPDQFDIQVKTIRLSASSRTDTFPAPVDERHLSLWRALSVPVLLICVDHGPPTTAYWKVIEPSARMPFQMTRHQVFGPGSRDEIISAIRRLRPRRETPGEGELLNAPLDRGLRSTARLYYFAELQKSPHPNFSFGPVQFTWKGWRHLTRRGRAMAAVVGSLLLLPSVRAVLDQATWSGARSFPIQWQGSRDVHRTLLAFDRVLHFRYRAPARVRVVVERDLVVPHEWMTAPPADSSRELVYRFLSVYEVSERRL